MPSMGDIAEAGQFLSGLVSNTGTRMSDEHFREGITRSNLFLEGTTPTNANAYNQYQNMTYGEDTQRQADRIKTMGKELGMSPWELTGNSTNTSPVQSFGESKPQDTQFLSQQMPLKIAEMQSRTQLANTFLQNQTAEKIESMRQGIGDDNTGGRVPKTVSGMQRFLMQGQAAQVQQSIDASRTSQILDGLRFIKDTLPDTEINTGLYNSKFKEGWDKVMRAYGAYKPDDPNSDVKTLQDVLKGMPSNEFEGWRKDFMELISLASAGAKGVTGLAKGAGNAYKQAEKFLGGLTRKTKSGTGLIGAKEAATMTIK